MFRLIFLLAVIAACAGCDELNVAKSKITGVTTLYCEGPAYILHEENTSEMFSRLLIGKIVIDKPANSITVSTGHYWDTPMEMLGTSDTHYAATAPLPQTEDKIIRFAWLRISRNTLAGTFHSPWREEAMKKSADKGVRLIPDGTENLTRLWEFQCMLPNRKI